MNRQRRVQCFAMFINIPRTHTLVLSSNSNVFTMVVDREVVRIMLGY